MSNSTREELGPHGLAREESQIEIAARLGEASSLLRAWANSEQSDSVQRQELRKSEYAQACRLLQEAHGDTFRAGKQIRITLPNDGKAVTTRSLERNAYDLYEAGHGDDLEPGQSVTFKTQQSLMNMHQRATNVYFGDYRHYFEVADIARILERGGSLDLIDATSAETAT